MGPSLGPRRPTDRYDDRIERELQAAVAAMLAGKLWS